MVGSADAYNLAKHLHQNYSAVQKALTRLVDPSYVHTGLVYIASREKASRGPEKRSVYDITRPGLWLLLHTATGPQTRRMAEAHGDELPLLLGKWKHFQDCKVEDLALKILHSPILRLPVTDFMESVMAAAFYVGSKSRKVDDLTPAFYLAAPLVLEKSEQKRWLTIFLRDKKLAGDVAEITGDVENRLIDNARVLMEFRTLLEKAEGRGEITTGNVLAVT